MSLCYLQYYHINVSDGDDEMMIMMITCVSLVVQSSGSSHQCVGPHSSRQLLFSPCLRLCLASSSGHK